MYKTSTVLQRTVMMVFAVLLAVSAFAAGEKESKTMVDDGSPTPISFLYADHSGHPFNENWLVFTEMEKRYNVDLQLQIVPDSDFVQKRQIVFASGDVPDIIGKSFFGDTQTFAPQGLLMPVSDYMDMLPDLQRLIDEWDMDRDIKSISLIDKKFYMAPGFQRDLRQSTQLAGRTDLFEKHYGKIPSNWDEVIDGIKAIQAADPDVLGFAGRNKGDAIISIVAPSFGIYSGFGFDANGGYFYDYNKEEWVYGASADNFKAMLQMFNRMYREGVMDPESFTHDSNGLNPKIHSGQVVMSMMWGGQRSSFRSEMVANGEGDDAWFQYFPPIASGIPGTRPTLRGAARIGGSLIFPADLPSRPHFEKVMKFVNDNYYSEEGTVLQNWGVEGETFQVVNGERELLPHMKNWRYPEGTMEGQRDYGVNTNNFKLIARPDFVEWNMSDFDREHHQKILAMKAYSAKPPTLLFTEDETEQVNLIATNLRDYISTMMLKFIYGAESFDNWDAYVAQLKTKGSDKLMGIVNTVWERQTK